MRSLPPDTLSVLSQNVSGVERLAARGRTSGRYIGAPQLPRHGLIRRRAGPDRSSAAADTSSLTSSFETELRSEYRVCARATALRRDEDDAVRRARAVDRRRRRALENLDALDVARIEIHHAVRRRRALELAADVLSADARRRPASIGLKFVVENEVLFTGTPSTTNSGSTLPFERAQSANRDLRSRARIARRLRDLHVRRFAGERLDDVRFVRLDDQLGRHGVANVAELLDFGRRAGAGDDDFAELQRIGLEQRSPASSVPGTSVMRALFGL